MKIKSLPRMKRSALIRLAIADMDKVKKSREYKLDMSKWYQTNGDCKVCLAGSVMAFSLEAKKIADYVKTTNPVYDFNSTVEIMPEDFGQRTERDLNFLNQIRQGTLDTDFSARLNSKFKKRGTALKKGTIYGYWLLNPYLCENMSNENLYKRNYKRFKQELQKVARLFKSIGE